MSVNEAFVPDQLQPASAQTSTSNSSSSSSLRNRKNGKSASRGTDNGSAATAAAAEEDESSGRLPPAVQLGDACIAAPFTSRRGTVQSTLDIIRQGRCTLVTTIQMYKVCVLLLSTIQILSAFQLSSPSTNNYYQQIYNLRF